MNHSQIKNYTSLSLILCHTCFIHIAFITCLWQRIAGEIKSFSTDGWVAPKFSRRMDKFMLQEMKDKAKELFYNL